MTVEQHIEPSAELAMQELDAQELEGLDAPDWWNSWMNGVALSAAVSVASAIAT
jgi:hypothetical protein